MLLKLNIMIIYSIKRIIYSFKKDFNDLFERD